MAFSALSPLLRASTSRFIHRSCLTTAPKLQSRFLTSVPRLTKSRITAHARAFSFTARTPAAAASPAAASTLSALPASALPTTKSAWPETSSRSVGLWLLGSAGLVFGIVVLGGLTRLTESGLSITEWKPVTGALPPLNAADWEHAFSLYRDSPEFRHLNPNMTLSEFKFIYAMEWGHRIWGRVIGLSFVLPAAYFIIRRRVTPRMARRLVGISALIGFQGFIGWWMVKSGLRDDLFAEPGSIPRVSQYRLTAHLGAAFTLYVAMLWNGLDILKENRLVKDPRATAALCEVLRTPVMRKIRGCALLLTGMVFTTSMLGGLVAGLDAGLIYNEFPKMGKGYMPPTSELFNSFYSRAEDLSDLVWRNMLENPATVQFQHRVVAISTFTAICAVFAFSRFNPNVVKVLPKDVRKGLMGVLHLGSLQVLLGIGTLIYMVPTHLAATHQAGALALLSGCVVVLNRSWVPAQAGKIAQRMLAEQVKKGAVKKGAVKGAVKGAAKKVKA